MLSCKEMTELATAYQERSLGFVQRLKFRLHLAMCDACRRYVRQLEATVGALRNAVAPPSEPSKDDLDAAVSAFRRWNKPS